MLNFSNDRSLRRVDNLGMKSKKRRQQSFEGKIEIQEKLSSSRWRQSPTDLCNAANFSGPNDSPNVGRSSPRRQTVLLQCGARVVRGSALNWGCS